MGRDPGGFPVSTYEHAKEWLFRFARVEEWVFDPDEPLPLVARFICDLNWVTADQLRRDLKADWNAALAPSRPAPLRPHHLARWR